MAYSEVNFTFYIYLYACPPAGRLRLKCDGIRAEATFRLSAKRTSPFKSAGASVQSTIGSRGVRISGSNAGYTMFRGSVKGTGYPLHSPVSPSLPLPCVTVCHHISAGLYVFSITSSMWYIQWRSLHKVSACYRGLGAFPDVQDTKICCGLFGTIYRSSDRMQYSRAL